METKQYNVKQALKAIETISRILDEADVKYELDDSNTRVEYELKGRDLDMNFTITAVSDISSVILYSVMPFVVPNDKKEKMAVAVASASYGLTCGNFEFDYSRGLVVFRMSINMLDSLMSEYVFRHLLEHSKAVVEEYNDKFWAVLRMDMTNDDIVRLID